MDPIAFVVGTILGLVVGVIAILITVRNISQPTRRKD